MTYHSFSQIVAGSGGQAQRYIPMNYEQRIIDLIESDEMRMRALRAASSLELADWLIGAGFVRNLIWGSIFDRHVGMNDIDVIYFCPRDTSRDRDLMLERQLHTLEPEFPWAVKNQARMHLKHGDAPYQNTLDAMRYWPEKETCIGVQLDRYGKVVVRHCFDVRLQFDGSISHNPARPIEVFKSRISSKGWLNIWPQLQVKM